LCRRLFAGSLHECCCCRIHVHVSYLRAPDIGEHNEVLLKQLGFSATEIDGLRASGTVPNPKARAA
jgi:crotonobetainyl-CoA:carnitine CoA-transferase CaiB-like acyl-CoA transferase